MEALQKNILMLKLVGLYSTSQNRFKSMFMIFFISWNMFFVWITTLFYTVSHISDITAMTYASYVVAAITLGLTQYWTFWINKDSLKIVINELQQVVTKSMKKKGKLNYTKI